MVTKGGAPKGNRNAAKPGEDLRFEIYLSKSRREELENWYEQRNGVRPNEAQLRETVRNISYNALEATLMVEREGVTIQTTQPVKISDYIDALLTKWRQAWPERETFFSTNSVYALFARIQRLANVQQNIVEQELAKFDITDSEFTLLTALRRAGTPYRLNPTELFKSLLTTSGTISKRISRLEKLGYVKREADPTDGRAVLVALTPQGLKIVETLFTTSSEFNEASTEHFSPQEQAQLIELLRKLLIWYEQHTLSATEAPPVWKRINEIVCHKTLKCSKTRLKKS